MPFNIPIVLTWCRILLIPLLVGVFYLPPEWMSLPEKNITSTGIFIVAALTDWLDGYLARRLQQTSAFGAFLDPVADKLMVAVALIVLVDLSRTSALVAIIIIGREIAISALREWMAQIGKSGSVAVSMVGKVKTVAQMVSIPMLLFNASILGVSMPQIGNWLIYVAALLTLWSMGYYIKRAWEQLKDLKI